ncbi:sulfotransferase domain-containing protein [Methylomonas sp. Kb3]|uniref:sulfotransferase domain-containing protein n=1 Tax=Methylomonas sp. Kb3 TaxID=1611544 RepID=UPI0013FD6489|nr:sulfotransferase domain-containing protein [Methylomonas sp. Kb3]
MSEYTSLMGGFVSAEKKPTRYEYCSKWFEYQFLDHYFAAVPPWRCFVRKFSGLRTLPDFCVVGPIKGGTSDLAVNIMLHPHIMPPLAKEYYSSDIDKLRILYPTEKQRNNHALVNGGVMCPFLAPYLNWMEFVHNFSIAKPNAKIVLTLRDPVDRLYSHWKWEVFQSGKERVEGLPFLSTFSAYVDKALSLFPEYPMYTVCRSEPLQTSIYWKAVSFWIECFGRENVLVLDIESYFLDKSRFLNEIYDFVGLPQFHIPSGGDRVNENPIELSPPDQESLLKLTAFFESHNQKLWGLLGKEFNWSK